MHDLISSNVSNATNYAPTCCELIQEHVKERLISLFIIYSSLLDAYTLFFSRSSTIFRLTPGDHTPLPSPLTKVADTEHGRSLKEYLLVTRRAQVCSVTIYNAKEANVLKGWKYIFSHNLSQYGCYRGRSFSRQVCLFTGVKTRLLQRAGEGDIIGALSRMFEKTLHVYHSPL